jgi:hypothetical protein
VTRIEELKAFLAQEAEMVSQRTAMHKWSYACLADLVGREGQAFPWAPKPRSIMWGAQGECYRNAYYLALGNPGYIYVEGYAFFGVIPIAHAWVVGPDGAVIDNTWQEDTVEGEERAYLGIPLKISYVNRVISERGKFGVLDCWELTWPLMTGEHVLAEAVEELDAVTA